MFEQLNHLPDVIQNTDFTSLFIYRFYTFQQLSVHHMIIQYYVHLRYIIIELWLYIHMILNELYCWSIICYKT